MSVLTRPDTVAPRSVVRPSVVPSVDRAGRPGAARSAAARSASSRSKRAIDVVGSGLGLILLLPVLIVVGLLVAITSPGGPLFRQTRVGLDGQPFSMVKFRTMRHDSHVHRDRLKKAAGTEGPLFKLVDDPRVTPIGRVLRRFSIDELPQLINVFRGEMSLVGPRPALPCEVDDYCERALGRLDATPGMTGAWQVGGRSTLDWQTGLDLDLHYVQHWSLPYDIVLLLKTVRAVVVPVGAY